MNPVTDDELKRFAESLFETRQDLKDIAHRIARHTTTETPRAETLMHFSTMAAFCNTIVGFGLGRLAMQDDKRDLKKRLRKHTEETKS